MLSRLRLPLLRLTVLALTALAMGMIGYSHRGMPAQAAHLAALDLAAYTLPDGSVPDLCAGGAGDPSRPATAAAICDACLLTAAPGLVPDAVPGLPQPIGLAPPRRFEPCHGILASNRVNPVSRGPPASIPH